MNDATKHMTIAFIISSLFLTLILYSAFSNPIDEITKTNDLYCEMTELYIYSGGDLGWPDYKGNRSKMC
jgi:hypothetical protein